MTKNSYPVENKWREMALAYSENYNSFYLYRNREQGKEKCGGEIKRADEQTYSC